jgi:hypothetical protein
MLFPTPTYLHHTRPAPGVPGYVVLAVRKEDKRKEFDWKCEEEVEEEGVVVVVVVVVVVAEEDDEEDEMLFSELEGRMKMVCCSPGGTIGFTVVPPQVTSTAVNGDTATTSPRPKMIYF